jgi:uncharacterized protein (TIRG00374 family)
MWKQIVSSLKLAAKFGFAFSVLAYMVHSGRLDLHLVRQGFSNGPALADICLLSILSLIASQYRWGMLMRGQGISFTLPQLFRYGMIGAFFNTTMPGAVSGDLIKAWYVLDDRKGLKKTPVFTSIFLDRIMGVFGLVIVSTLPVLLFWSAVWTTPALKEIALPMLACFAGIIGALLYVLLSGWGALAALRSKFGFLGKSRIGSALLQAYDALVQYRECPWILVWSLLLSVINFFCMVGVALICGRALGDTTLTFYQYFLLVPIGILTTAIPIAPAGLGVGHAAFRTLFLLVGSTRGSEVFTMMATVQILINLTGVFFYIGSHKITPETPVPDLASPVDPKSPMVGRGK